LFTSLSDRPAATPPSPRPPRDAWSELAATIQSLPPGNVRKKPLSDMTLTKVLRDMKLDATAHGFRSSFRDWVSEETQFDGAVAELALAHTIENKVEAAYRRGNLLDKRLTQLTPR